MTSRVETVNVREAKTHLSRLLRRVAAGEAIVLANAGRPVARLIPVSHARPGVLGSDRGLFRVPADFDTPLPDEVPGGF